MELTRKQVIEILELIKKQYHPFNINQQRLICALDYTISSLKTDEAYQIMYEGGEIFTKADMMAMLTELQLEIEELDTPNNGSAYIDCVDIIQQKINALTEGTDDR